MNSFVVAALLFCAAVVSAAPSGPWASAPIVYAPQPIYYTKPLVSGWEAPAKSDGWAAPAPPKKEEATTAAPVKHDGWAAPVAAWAPAKVDPWAPAKVDPWASSASAWSSHVVLKPAYYPWKTVKYIPAPHYYVSPHSW